MCKIGKDIKINLKDGKYQVVWNDNPHKFEVLRYGEKWRDLTGDEFVLAMFQEIVRLRQPN